MEQHNRYILSLDILPVDQPGNPVMVHSAHPNVPAALEALLQRPMDQFHPTSAANKKMPYIRHAQVFDLGKGIPVYSSDSFSSRDGQTGGFFLKIEDPANPFASGQLTYNDGYEPWPREQLLLMVYDESGGGHMRPSNLLYMLLKDCSGQTLTPGSLEYNSQFVMVAIGYKLAGASVIGDAVVYPTVAEQHYFPHAVAGFAKLASLSADEFEKESAMAKGLSQYYLKAYLAREAERGISLVDMFCCLPGRHMTGYPELEPGRYLYFAPGSEELNRSLGVQVKPGDGMVEGANVFMLDAWNKNGEGAFVQHPFARAVEALIAKSMQGSNANPEFTFCAHYHPLITGQVNNQNLSVADMIDYYYTDDLSEALLLLLRLAVTNFDRQRANNDGSSFQIMDCKLLDGAQRLVGGYTMVDEQDNFPAKGVYLGLHSDLMQQPAIRALDLEVLKDGVHHYDIKQGDMHYFQAAVYWHGTLVMCPGFEKLGLYHTWNHVAKVQAQNPGARQVPSLPVTDQHLYRLQYEWIVPQSDGSTRFTYIEGFHTPWAALTHMDLVPKENFFPPDGAVPQRPLLLDKISLCDQAGEAIITKGRDRAFPDKLYVEINDSLVNDRVHEALGAMINGKLAAGPQQEGPGDEKLSGKKSHPRKQRPGQGKGRGI